MTLEPKFDLVKNANKLQTAAKAVGDFFRRPGVSNTTLALGGVTGGTVGWNSAGEDAPLLERLLLTATLAASGASLAESKSIVNNWRRGGMIAAKDPSTTRWAEFTSGVGKAKLKGLLPAAGASAAYGLAKSPQIFDKLVKGDPVNVQMGNAPEGAPSWLWPLLATGGGLGLAGLGYSMYADHLEREEKKKDRVTALAAAARAAGQSLDPRSDRLGTIRMRMNSAATPDPNDPIVEIPLAALPKGHYQRILMNLRRSAAPKKLMTGATPIQLEKALEYASTLPDNE